MGALINLQFGPNEEKKKIEENKNKNEYKEIKELNGVVIVKNNFLEKKKNIEYKSGRITNIGKSPQYHTGEAR